MFKIWMWFSLSLKGLIGVFRKHPLLVTTCYERCSAETFRFYLFYDLANTKETRMNNNACYLWGCIHSLFRRYCEIHLSGFIYIYSSSCSFRTLTIRLFRTNITVRPREMTVKCLAVIWFSYDRIRKAKYIVTSSTHVSHFSAASTSRQSRLQLIADRNVSSLYHRRYNALIIDFSILCTLVVECYIITAVKEHISSWQYDAWQTVYRSVGISSAIIDTKYSTHNGGKQCAIFQI